jgi:hypothetical protein
MHPLPSARSRSTAACAVDNIAERIPVEVLTGDERARVLAQRSALGWQYARLFNALADESADRLTKQEAQRIEAAMTVLRCRRTLPAEARVSLLWGAGVATASGLGTDAEQALAFAVRPISRCAWNAIA